ncbi:hypothetical protein FRC06_007868 [Ceratobasidium sp. 370]|nr:hypothetical protein FRC06_007868 [Ceratobasidium sp. 370]
MFEHSPPSMKGRDGKEVPVDGSSDEKPIHLGGHPLATLHDVELETICKVLYDMPGIALSKLELKELIDLFYASRKFQFEAIYQVATELLETAPVPPWKRYSMAMHCLNETWLLRSCIEICSLAEYPPADLFAEFARLNAPERLASLLKIREVYRTNLLDYARGGGHCPTGFDYGANGATACDTCRNILKALLHRILTGNSTNDLGGVDPAKLPLLKDRVAKGIQPRTLSSLNICGVCRAKEAGLIVQVLGPADLERRIKEVKSLVSL